MTVGMGGYNRMEGGIQSDGPYGQKISRTIFFISSSLVGGHKPGEVHEFRAMMSLARHRPIFEAAESPILRASDSLKGCWREQSDT